MDFLNEVIIIFLLHPAVTLANTRKFSQFGSPGGCFTQVPKQVTVDSHDIADCAADCILFPLNCVAFIFTKDRQCRLYDQVQKLDNDDRCVTYFESGAQLNIVGSPAKLDSIDPNWNAYASRAVDGGLSQDFGDGSCVLAGTSFEPRWLLVDIQDNYVIVKVVVVHRNEHSNYVQRFTKMSLLVSEDTSVWTTFSKDKFTLCRYLEGPPSLEALNVEFQCVEPKPKGRFVSLHKDVTEADLYANVIDACEILVYVKATNI